MKVRDLFEAANPIAKSLKDFATLAKTHRKIFYKGMDWKEHWERGQKNIQWVYTPLKLDLEFGKRILINVEDEKPYSISDTDTDDYVIVDPAIFLSKYKISPENKYETIKKILYSYRMKVDSEEGDLSHLRNILVALKMLGHDWPELKTIEKSIK